MLKVFIADDSPLVRERLSTMLSDSETLGAVELVGYAEGARGAIKAIRHLEPDVAILDIRLSEGSGIDVIEAVKASGSASMIIVLTAFPYPQYRERCIEAGADFFFDKSTEFDRVSQVIADLCEA